MKIFVDVNVFLDVQRKRVGWKSSFAIIESVINKKNEGYISALTPILIYYLRRRITSERNARLEALDLTKEFRVIGLTSKLINASIKEGE
jgi:predicted nucleic acid-binding protein